MNNDLEQFSEEELTEIINDCTGEIYNTPTNDETTVSPRVLLSLAHISLAAKQAKPVCFIGKQMLSDLAEENRSCGRVWLAARDEVDGNDRIPLYTTPQPAHTEQDGWIKCSERMPESTDEGCIVFCLDGVRRTGFVSSGDWAINGKYYASEFVTHWMPLPAAPKPESE